MPLNENFIQDLKLKTDIYDIVSTYVTLKKRGRTYVGLCPFHNEKTPSFTVYPDTESFYCFGCGAGGDAVGFMKRIENLDYIDAVKALAQRAGMQMPDESTYDDSLAKKRRIILEINRESAKFFNSYMMSDEGKAGHNYFLNRGLSENTIKRFGLGYAPNSWDMLLKHLKGLGYSINDMADAGVIKKGEKGYYDNFRNRVMTPIIDVRGNVIAFGGRVLDDSKPKYINTGDTLVYKKTNELFALNLAKDSGSETIILCEGYMDVIAMHQAGFTNAVAGCGTALTSEQVRLISRYAKEVILAYDADEAGQKARDKAVTLFNQTDIKIKIPILSGGKDPDEIIKNLGKERFKGMLLGASNEIEFAILSAKNKYELNSTQGKIDFINECIKYLVNASPVEQDLYISRISEELGVEKRSIKLQLDEYKQKVKRRSSAKEYRAIVNDSIRESRKQEITSSATTRQIKAEQRLLGILMLYPDCIKLCENFDTQQLSAGFIRNTFELTCEKINNGLDTDLINYSSKLSDNEMGMLSGIIARSNNSLDAKKEFNDCLKILSEEFDKKNNNTSSMNDDEFRNLFRKTNNNMRRR
ncbi:MAG: DNA primase [Eubacterium sp.]|nr:DNA primase [Eubacterium sp.]